MDLVQLIACHQAGVWRILRALGCDACSADDLTQETFLEVMRRPLSSIAPSHRRLSASRGPQLFITLRRRSGKVVYTRMPMTLNSPGCVGGFDGGNRALTRWTTAFKRLTLRAQQALRMRFADEPPASPIADELDISELRGKNLMQRAKTQLRECVESKLQ